MTPSNRLSTWLLLLLPIAYVVGAVILRDVAGPFWNWHTSDASYYYLFDAIHVSNLDQPGHLWHPGVPVQLFVGLVMWLSDPFASHEEVVTRVLDDPEAAITILSTAMIILTATASFIAGRITTTRTESVWLGMILQLTPFLSMVMFKVSYHVKPEPFLMAVMLIWSAWTVMMVTDPEPEKNRTRYAVGFGLLFGLGVSAKMTMAPMFAMPLVFFIWNRAIWAYLASTVAGLALFTAYAWPSLHMTFDTAWASLSTTGAYQHGEKGFIDLARYPQDFSKLLRRPTALVPFLLGSGAVAFALYRWRRGLAFPKAETLGLAGVATGVLAMAAVIAKQPTAHYMVPAYMLTGLAIVLLVRFIAACRTDTPVLGRIGRSLVLGLLLIGIVAQSFAVVKEGRELAEKREGYMAIRQNPDHDTCARFYFFSASSETWSLLTSDWKTGLRLKDELHARYPENHYWLEIGVGFRNALGYVDTAAIVERAQCVIGWGTRLHEKAFYREFTRAVPGFTFDRVCPSRDSHLTVKNIDC